LDEAYHVGTLNPLPGNTPETPTVQYMETHEAKTAEAIMAELKTIDHVANILRRIAVEDCTELGLDAGSMEALRK
jgi:hypothetical protein